MPDRALAIRRPASLAGRFALAAAGLAFAALVLTSLASWWLMAEQQKQAVQNLSRRDTAFRAAAVGSDLQALAARMDEISGSTILATGLVDSAGRETYLTPFIGAIRQINGLPVQVMFTDFEGREIASSNGAKFDPAQLAWLRGAIQAGHAVAKVFDMPGGAQLVAFEPMTYARTASPEGAVLYKIALNDVNAGEGLQLHWGAAAPGADALDAVPVPVPPVFADLGFRVQRAARAMPVEHLDLALPYLHVLAIALGIFAMVVLVGLRLARAMTLDLAQLSAFASQREGGRHDPAPVPQSSSTEVATLATAINEMLQRLGEQHAALLAEREKLTQLTDTLQVADRRKDDFLAMLGHELRNPMAPIRTAADLLGRLSTTDARVAKASEIIVRQTSHMTKLIEDLLDVSRVTRGLITLDKAEVELGEVLSAAMEQVRPVMESARHLIRMTRLSEPVIVLGDHARLVQVFGNLLINAAKYTPSGGQIDVHVDARRHEAIVEIRDNGVGISPELMPEIFDLFTQGSRTSDRRLGGLGLGLALVKRLVGLHGGVVHAESGGIGRGSKFSVHLPRAEASARPAGLPDALPPAVAAAAGGHGVHRVLIVDDNRDAADMLVHLLSDDGHLVTVAYDAFEALERAEGNRFDVCILDIGLPGMDGYELARRLRTEPAAASARFIALSGYGQGSDKARSLARGFDEHLVKPADIETIRGLLVGQGHAATAPRTASPVDPTHHAL
jgi:signal transduction histidine kinase/ActR/RegA family two-component response regulator